MFPILPPFMFPILPSSAATRPCPATGHGAGWGCSRWRRSSASDDVGGVQILEQPEDWNSIVPGEDLEVTWTPPTRASPSRIQLLLQTGWHGSPSLTTIWCETEDDGALVVPASLTAEFPIPSCGECGTSYLRRFTRDVVDFGQGPIQLLVAWQRPFVAWMTGLY